MFFNFGEIYYFMENFIKYMDITVFSNLGDPYFLMEIFIKYLNYVLHVFQICGNLNIWQKISSKYMKLHVFQIWGDPITLWKIYEYYRFFKFGGTLSLYGKFHKIHGYYRFLGWTPGNGNSPRRGNSLQGEPWKTFNFHVFFENFPLENSVPSKLKNQ